MLRSVAVAMQGIGAEVAHQLKTGDSFWVGGGVEHQASSEAGAEILDIFSPYREEYAAQ